MNDETRLLRGRLNGAQKNRMRKLRDMYYKPGEIAEIVGIKIKQFYRVYIPEGCPHERDERNHIWINGKQFRNWVETTYKKRKLGENQAYCSSCDQSVDLENRERKTTKTGDTDYIEGNCIHCGRKTVRIVENRRGQ